MGKIYGKDNQKQDRQSVLERLKNLLQKATNYQQQIAIKNKDRGARQSPLNYPSEMSNTIINV